MMVTMDGAGRIVIPKEIRDRLQLTPDVQLDLETDGDSITIQRAAEPTRELAWTEDGRPYFPAVEGHTVSDLDVQQLRDAGQR